jgi:dTMP kinase
MAEFITLEGIEGVGKSTAVATVAECMRALGREVVLTREPGGTKIGERIRALLLDPGATAMSAVAELLLMFAARAQHLNEVIEPALGAGKCVVCDRFSDASFAYQGGGRGLSDATIAAAEDLVHPQLQPNLTLLLDAPAELALRRAHARSAADRFEREELAFFERVRATYLQRAASHRGRFCVIDASRSLSEVSEELQRELNERFV